MRNLFFLLMAGFALSMLSCNSDPAGTQNVDEETDTYATTESNHDPFADPEYPDGKPYPGEPGETIPTPPPVYMRPLELIFTVDDIKSFNVTTREIVFTNLIVEKLTTEGIFAGIYLKPNIEGVYVSVTIYHDDKPLFKEIPLASPVMSNTINDLVLIFIIHKTEFYLADGYPDWKPDDNVIVKGGDGTIIDWRKIRAENAEKRKAEWDIFIKYLTDVGKIVE